MSEAYQHPRVGVGAVLINEQGQVLLGLRSGSHGANEWALTGGKLDLWETPEECGHRETLEECGLTGVNWQPIPFWSNETYPDWGRHFVTIYVCARSLGGEPVICEPDKCLQWRWFDWQELRDENLPLFAGIRNLAFSYESTEDFLK